MSKLDPGLRYLLSVDPQAMPEIALESAFGVEMREFQPPLVNLLIEMDGDVAALEAIGVRVRTRAGSVVSAQTSMDRIAALADVPGLRRAEVSRVLNPELDRALPAANVTALHNGLPASGGAGVIVGIID